PDAHVATATRTAYPPPVMRLGLALLLSVGVLVSLPAAAPARSSIGEDSFLETLAYVETGVIATSIKAEQRALQATSLKTLRARLKASTGVLRSGQGVLSLDLAGVIPGLLTVKAQLLVALEGDNRALSAPSLGKAKILVRIAIAAKRKALV